MRSLPAHIRNRVISNYCRYFNTTRFSTISTEKTLKRQYTVLFYRIIRKVFSVQFSVDCGNPSVSVFALVKMCTTCLAAWEKDLLQHRRPGTTSIFRFNFQKSTQWWQHYKLLHQLSRTVRPARDVFAPSQQWRTDHTRQWTIGAAIKKRGTGPIRNHNLPTVVSS